MGKIYFVNYFGTNSQGIGFKPLRYSLYNAALDFNDQHLKLFTTIKRLEKSIKFGNAF
ncbi:MAG: hypothetical protein CM15mP16_12520 [Candidatus Pelagibacterales bacterium]|nr:MAG: hypothetical protein CM15mP16_12520 [Pelagibacterales bacterium]